MHMVTYILHVYTNYIFKYTLKKEYPILYIFKKKIDWYMWLKIFATNILIGKPSLMGAGEFGTI